MALEILGLCPLLSVFDMPTALRFYRDLLGFEVATSDRPGDDCDWVWLKRIGMELMLNTAYDATRRPPRSDPARIAAHSDTQIYIGCPDPEAAYQYLRASGLDVKPPVVRDFGMRQLFIQDPDGYTLCFQWPVR
jgi:glyoxylase I family protein